MRIAPLSVISLAVLIASALVPLAPVWLTVVPLPDLVGGLSKFLF
ncbi:MAG TPA: hypothetical protein VF136_16730 [Methylomirabilota bacterium]